MFSFVAKGAAVWACLNNAVRAGQAPSRVEGARLCSPLVRFKQLHVMHNAPVRKQVVIIAGCTAIGKTEVGVNLAQMINGEVISADSVQVYKGMDCGTSKPSSQQMELIPHHFVNTLSPTVRYTAVDFAEGARAAIQDIHDRGKVPIIVGGNGFYLKALLSGASNSDPSSAQRSDAALSSQLRDEILSGGWDSSLARLAEVDPVYAKSVSRNDVYRLVRALEIVTQTGKPVTASKWSDDVYDPDLSFECFFLHGSRLKLYRRIDKRCEVMVQSGLLQEVLRLANSGDLRPKTPASRAIGYSHALAFLAAQDRLETASFRRFLADFQRDTRNFAKRQITWFRNMKPPCSLVDAHDMENALEEGTAERDLAVARVAKNIERTLKNDAGVTRASLKDEQLSRKEERELKRYRAVPQVYTCPTSVQATLDRDVRPYGAELEQVQVGWTRRVTPTLATEAIPS